MDDPIDYSLRPNECTVVQLLVDIKLGRFRIEVRLGFSAIAQREKATQISWFLQVWKQKYSTQILALQSAV